MVVLSLESYIRKMPLRAFVKLSACLDPGGLWERMAARIPLRLQDIDDENAEKRYTQQTVAVFAYMGQRAGGESPTKKILQDWGTKNARIHQLITILTQAELFAAADYLHNDLLNLGPAPRPNPEPEPQPPCNNNNITTDNDNGDGGDGDGRRREGETAPGAVGGVGNPQQPSNSSSCAYDVGELGFELRDISSETTGTMSNRQSYESSPRASVLDESAVPFSCLVREVSVDCADKKDAWIGLEDIQIQTIPYKMLGLITENFNEEPLEKGGRLIGSGGFGMVYQGQFHNGFKVAVKCLRQTSQMKLQDLLKQFENEVKTLATYRHDNVVHLLGYSIDGPSQCLVYQYLPNGSLEDRLARAQGKPPLSANMRVKIVKGAAKGIQFLNDNGYVHRDVKSANILLDSEFTAKVGDFATVVTAPSGEGQTVRETRAVIGTMAYLAPEALGFDVSTKLDAYSFGVVLLEIITGLAPQDNAREEVTLTSHIMENVEEPAQIHDYVDPAAGEWGEGVVDKLYDIALRCLTHSKRRRPNISHIAPELESL